MPVTDSYFFFTLSLSLFASLPFSLSLCCRCIPSIADTRHTDAFTSLPMKPTTSIYIYSYRDEEEKKPFEIVTTPIAWMRTWKKKAFVIIRNRVKSSYHQANEAKESGKKRRVKHFHDKVRQKEGDDGGEEEVLVLGAIWALGIYIYIGSCRVVVDNNTRRPEFSNNCVAYLYHKSYHSASSASRDEQESKPNSRRDPSIFIFSSLLTNSVVFLSFFFKVRK